MSTITYYAHHVKGVALRNHITVHTQVLAVRKYVKHVMVVSRYWKG
jgi:hypothetical protein